MTQILSTVRFLPIFMKFLGTEKLLIVAALTLVFHSTIFANDGSRLGSFKQLCISDQGTGFNWKRGSWEQVNFVEERFVVSKINVPDIPPGGRKELGPEALWITIRCNKSDFIEKTEGDFRIYNSCLKLQSLGEKHAEYFKCSEIHRKEGNSWVVKSNCKGGPAYSFSMIKDGNFHRSSVPANLLPNPENDYKDSLSIFVGKCASIED